MSAPSWVQDAIFYQIFPDRFANGDTGNDPADLQPWGAKPTLRGFQGGDLQGIVQRFDYLLELGVNALYLNPIFAAASNHRYDTMDYYRIDPRLGTREEFQRLLTLAHKHDMHVILDGVFNHCGREFFAFQDVLENEERSKYRDWFYVRRFPLDASGDGIAKNYEAWWGMRSLPKFNVDNPQVRKYLLDVARFWIQEGVDGWRLDVPNEIEEASFWVEFRDTVKSVNPQAYLVGEIWEVDPSWVGDQRFDGLMNYPVRKSLLNFFQEENASASEFESEIQAIYGAYERENTFSHFLTLGTHDTERVRTALNADLARTRLAFQFIFTYPGAPSIFYGDEVGLQGGKDPDCRQAFPWDPSDWEHDLRDHIRKLISTRRSSKALRQGRLRFLPLEGSARAFAFSRAVERDAVIAVFNPSSSMAFVEVAVDEPGIAHSMRMRSLLDGEVFQVQDGRIALGLAPWQGRMLTPADSSSGSTDRV